MLLHPTPPCEQERSLIPTAALCSPCAIRAGGRYLFLGHLSTPFPPAALLDQQLLLSEAAEKPPACSGHAPGNRKAGFYRGQRNATRIKQHVFPRTSACTPRAPVKKQGKMDRNLIAAWTLQPARSHRPPFGGGGTSGALQMWPWHVPVWLCTGSKPGLWCCQQPPCASARRGRDTCPGTRPAMQKHPPSWINALTLPPGAHRPFHHCWPLLLHHEHRQPAP